MKYNDNGTIKEIPVKASDTLPIGSIVAYSSSKAPENWLICDGSEISRTLYSELFNIIGTTYGEGDGSTTFNLPNLKGKVITGLDGNDETFNKLGNTGGEKTHTLTTSELPSHKHSLVGNIVRSEASSGNLYTVSNQRFLVGRYKLSNMNVSATDDTAAFINVSDLNSSTMLGISSTGSGTAHNNLQPYIVQNYIIKVSQSIAVVGKSLNNKSESTQDTYSCDYINRLNTYSTTEQRVGTWIDDKPIYRKVIQGTTASSNSPIAIGSIPNLEIITDIRGYIINSSQIVPINFVYNTEQNAGYKEGNNIIVRATASSYQSKPCYVIVEYTKTTD